MAKFAFLGFLLVIVIAVINGSELVKQSLEVIKIKEAMKNETFVDHLMDCMYDAHMHHVPVCHTYRMRLAMDLIRLAYQYDEITHKCLTGEHDPPLEEACELYQLLKIVSPKYWENNLAVIKDSVIQKQHVTKSAPKMLSSIADMLNDDGAVAVAVTKCIINKNLCFDMVIKQIREVLVFAEAVETCPDPANRKSPVCRLYFAFQRNFPSLYEKLHNQNIVYEYDAERGKISFKVINDEF